MKFKIVATPPGDAPENIRAAWVGLTLSGAKPDNSVETTSVMSAPSSTIGWFFARICGKTNRETGYMVNAPHAIDALAIQSPEAAAWWRSNAPRAITPKSILVFAPEVCVVLSGTFEEPDAVVVDTQQVPEPGCGIGCAILIFIVASLPLIRIVFLQAGLTESNDPDAETGFFLILSVPIIASVTAALVVSLARRIMRR